jgi:hypothetical protein
MKQILECRCLFRRSRPVVGGFVGVDGQRRPYLCPEGAIDSFAKKVRVAVVPGVLGDHVDHDPA